jgi:2-dehydro-3-deoxyglucarate aldolase
MNRLEKINELRQALESGKVSIGSWMQIPNASVAEIMGRSGYSWVAVDMEHGSIDFHQLPDIFRALELGGTLPLVRLASQSPENCKHALDAGAGGVIVPMIENAEQLEKVKSACRWPPAGIRGIGFSRANLFGKYFDAYTIEAQSPLLVAMIESIFAVESLESILNVEGLDAILIGPYDLSSTMGMTGSFNTPEFKAAINRILSLCKKHNIPCGMHVVQPDGSMLQKRIDEGYLFIAYSIDAVFLSYSASLNQNK